jgi:hypothetical protein
MPELFSLTLSCVWFHSTISKGYSILGANQITVIGSCGSQLKTVVLPCLFVCLFANNFVRMDIKFVSALYENHFASCSVIIY